MTNYKQTALPLPTLHVAVKGERTKDILPVHNNNVYLKDKQEFIIVLHNTTTETISAWIAINGKPEDSMLVLRPGERAWLERYLDSDNKFVFETYNVDNTEQNQEAIVKNGVVQVKFYEEARPEPRKIVQQPIIVEQPIFMPYWIRPWCWPTCNPGIYYGNMTDGISGCSSNYTTGDSQTNFSASVGTTDHAQKSFSDDAKKHPGRKFSRKFGNTLDELSRNVEYNDELNMDFAETDSMIETGRVEKGEASGQVFNESKSRFKLDPFHSAELRLMPERYAPKSAEDFKQACGKCGRKQRKSENFCPNCGTRY